MRALTEFTEGSYANLSIRVRTMLRMTTATAIRIQTLQCSGVRNCNRFDFSSGRAINTFMSHALNGLVKSITASRADEMIKGATDIEAF
jgi:hypothetical protein